ncbi:asparagine synthase-related protein [Anabaena azotica]|uniref:asparagine synthase-related protein n=1 Tax=Anabaena azotica TaxID=197653 RepID=UPI0039A447E4
MNKNKIDKFMQTSTTNKMTNKINLHFSPRFEWLQYDKKMFFRSAAFANQQLQQEQEVFDHLRDAKTEDEWIAAIKKINSFFAVVHHQSEQCYAAVDRVRSIPLFYGVENDNFYLSDDAKWVQEKVGDKEHDPLAETEFLLTGYVTGSDTLYPQVKQLQAGECLFVKNSAMGLQLSKKTYFQYHHKYSDTVKESELLEQLDEVLNNVFQRLVNLAQGRTLVIPLSGGLDSRLVALMLKRIGYDNIITFSYGKPGNKESKTSQEVAENLNLRWEFVPYSRDAWYRWFHSHERKTHYQISDTLSSSFHLQDWPAIWELKQKCVIPENSIFIPGHSADLLEGSRSTSMPHLYQSEQKQISSDDLVAAIIKYHYRLRSWGDSYNQFAAAIRKKILTSLDDLQQFPDIASAFESWDMKERQAKFVVNSVRVYEFWEYDWWLPFFDLEFIDFWSNVPLQYRVNRKLFGVYIQRLYLTMLNVDKQFTTLSIMDIFKPYIKSNSLLMFIIKKMELKFYSPYDHHSLCWYGCLPKKIFNKQYSGIENINSFLSLEYLGKINFNDE